MPQIAVHQCSGQHYSKEPKGGNTPECPLIKYMKKKNIYMETLFSLKRSNNLIHAATWMNLEDIVLSDTSRTQKDKHCVALLPRGTWSRQIHGGRKWTRAADLKKKDSLEERLFNLADVLRI